jgi:hypothetical protein
MKAHHGKEARQRNRNKKLVRNRIVSVKEIKEKITVTIP